MSRPHTYPKGLQVCKACKHTNLVWYRAKSGVRYLATPRPGTLDPDPRLVHLCQFRRRKGPPIIP
jgi:hypothetical protein